MNPGPAWRMVLGVIVLALGAARAHAQVVAAADLKAREQWVIRHLVDTGQHKPVPEAKEADGLPFSFVYGGKASKGLLPSWPRKDDTKTLDSGRVQRTATWTDPKTGLEVRCTSVEYADFPVVEWTIHFRNRGSWVNVGTWEIDKTRFPRGIREVADRVHSRGTKFVLWFEPERVTDGSWLADHHPDWILKSGGRRNDLETLRRSVPLLRSDCFSPAEAQQAHTMGIALWMPYYGSGMYPGDVYWYRSCIFPASRIGMDTRKKDQDYALLKKMMAEFHRVEKYLLGDFYPLTVHSLAIDVWVGWQFDRPELGEGMVQVFRRAESPYETARFQLRGLDPKAVYRLTDFDKPRPMEAHGKDLMETGLLVSLP